MARWSPVIRALALLSPAALTQWARALSCTIVLAHLGCSSEGNTGQRAPDPSLVEAAPWLNAALPALDGGYPVIPSTPVYPPIASGMPDPGSRPANCAGLDGIETAPAWVATFEPDTPNDPTQVGIGSAWSAFDDSTPYAFHVPGDATWYSGLNGKYGAPFGLPSDKVDGPSCDGAPNHWALHFRGGLFRKWGGGVSHVLTDPDGCPAGADFCPPPTPPGATEDSAGLPLAPPDGGTYAQSHAFIDVSAYDGIAFWARRGPEGQARMIVTLTDSFTSDRLARQNQKYCRRVSPVGTGNVCHTQCANGAPCAPENPAAADSVYRCIDPRGVHLPDLASLTDLIYPRCGPSACLSAATNPDPDFDGKACRPYTFPAADESGEYCFNEGDPPPPNREERCLDGFASSVELTLDWQYYKVPFSELRQGGYGRMAPYFNLKAVDTIAFGFIVGWADLYLDNVTFYRLKK
jgi:hypothetical protein